jgi:hypothetical protein
VEVFAYQDVLRAEGGVFFASAGLSVLMAVVSLFGMPADNLVCFIHIEELESFPVLS